MQTLQKKHTCMCTNLVERMLRMHPYVRTYVCVSMDPHQRDWITEDGPCMYIPDYM